MKKKLPFILLIFVIFFSCASTNKKLAQKRAEDFNYQYNVGLFHLNEGNLNQAIQYLNKCLSLNSNYYLAYNALGLVYAMQGDLEKSIIHFEKCLKINPDFTEAHNNLGIMYQQMGFLDKAQEEYLKVVKDFQYPHKELPYYNLALLSFVQNKAKEALEYIDRALKENSEYEMGYNLKGKILEELGKLEEAIENYRKALEIVPEEINFKFNLAIAFFKHQDYQEAKEIFDSLLTKSLPSGMKEKVEEYLQKIK